MTATDDRRTPATADRNTVPKAERPAPRPVRAMEDVGKQLRFYGEALASIPMAVTSYRRELLRLLAEVSLGTGALAVTGGTVVIVSFMTAAVGLEVGLQGYSQLGSIGLPALSGFVSAYVNTREAAPLIAMIAMIATVGGGFTAQLGAMRVSEEIDALETMAVRSVSFLVSTRIVAGLLAVVPLYAISLIVSYSATRFVITTMNSEPSGTYQHYFMVFLSPTDIFISMFKVAVMAMVVILVHCYYGFTATGGPVGVGVAVGRAVRTSLIIVMVTDLLLSMVLYGHSSINISG